MISVSGKPITKIVKKKSANMFSKICTVGKYYSWEVREVVSMI
jgi:hypothetical protein